MCRYLQAEQVIGYTFVELLEREKYEIALSRLSSLQRELEVVLRRETDTVVCSSDSDVYSLVSGYADFFHIKGNNVGIVDTQRGQIENNHEAREKFITKLKRYFLSGIPKDINQVMDEALRGMV